MTLVALAVIACLNHVFKHPPPFHGLQHLTHWFLLLAVSALVVRARWWTASVSAVGVVVVVLHWALVLVGARHPPQGKHAVQNLLCYAVLPLLAFAAAAATDAYEAPLARTVPSLVVMLLVCTAVVMMHDRNPANPPAYSNVPCPVPVLCAMAILCGTLWLLVMRRLRPRAPWLTFDWD